MRTVALVFIASQLEGKTNGKVHYTCTSAMLSGSSVSLTQILVESVILIYETTNWYAFITIWHTKLQTRDSII